MIYEDMKSKFSCVVVKLSSATEMSVADDHSSSCLSTTNDNDQESLSSTSQPCLVEYDQLGNPWPAAVSAQGLDGSNSALDSDGNQV